MLNSPPKKFVLPEEGFVRLNQVLEVIPVSRSTWYSWVKSGKAPKPISLGQRMSAYPVKGLRHLMSELSSSECKSA